MAEYSEAYGPAPMEGHGAYNRSSSVQAAGSSPAVPLLEKAAQQVLLSPASEPIVIVDYGSSAGRNSLVPLGAAIKVLRKRIAPERAISVVHTDLPANDFTALFRVLSSDPGSYLGADPAIFPSAVGRSFYEQILPSSSVTLGWSSWAVQWLSRVPGLIPDQVQVAYSQDATARTAFYQQAAADWRCFLVHRAAELRPGGRLVVLSMALDDHGDFGYGPAVAAIYGAVLDLVDQGFISREEGRRMVIPTVARSRQDFMAPFVGSAALLPDSRWRRLRFFMAKIASGQNFRATAMPGPMVLGGLPFLARQYAQLLLPAWIVRRFVRPSLSIGWRRE